MQNAFSRNILKSVIGNERAINAFKSISLSNIEIASSFNNDVEEGKTASAGVIKKAQSLNDIGNLFQSSLQRMRNKIVRGHEIV